MRALPDLARYDAIYSPYSDCGIFGHYFFGDPNYTMHMSYLGGIIGEIMSEYLTDIEGSSQNSSITNKDGYNENWQKSARYFVNKWGVFTNQIIDNGIDELEKSLIYLQTSIQQNE